MQSAKYYTEFTKKRHQSFCARSNQFLVFEMGADGVCMDMEYTSQFKTKWIGNMLLVPSYLKIIVLKSLGLGSFQSNTQYAKENQ